MEIKSLMRASTGLEGLDNTIDSLRLGDNVVWQVDSIKDYRRFVEPFVKNAIEEGRKVIYMRFAQHPPVIDRLDGLKVCRLDALSGFESFSVQVYEIATREGEEAYYVFDCLSDLLPAWASDLMIGNFFVITCPYLFELYTIAYFAIYRNSHSFSTVARIRETTQLLVDIYNCDGKYYVHPLKVWNRYSPTMFLPHSMDDGDLNPVTSSMDVTRLFAFMPGRGIESEERNLDYWDRLFMKAAGIYRRILEGESSAFKEQEAVKEQLYKLVIGRDDKILVLARGYLSMKDLLDIKTRLIGSGYIGGKAVGMLIARSILSNDTDFDWKKHLEPHDSFYIGSDVFYSYIVQNGWWRLRMKQRSSEGYFEVAPELKDKMLKGVFPEAIKEQFRQMLEYFGQSPIIVRSSSLLEDAFGNAFAGKYKSVFCTNQGTPADRYRQFENAVREVYASTMNEDALAYRLQRGLDKRDEQMAILVQRVSGDYHARYFYPDLAGVGISYNTYVWKSDMNPKAGMIRLVYGLGTRAVDRVEGDYPRVVALDAPLVRPHAGFEDIRKYSQHDVDVLDIEKNKFETVPFSDLSFKNRSHVIDMVAIRDHISAQRARQFGQKTDAARVLAFEKFLSNTPFVSLMQTMLKTLEQSYNYPVDTEFTVNFQEDERFHINLLQCRPLQVKGLHKNISIPSGIDEADIVFKSVGNFMGGSISQIIDVFILVMPEEYSSLDIQHKYEAARLVGKLNRLMGSEATASILMAGPGRWGTSTPSLGVPVTFSEINNSSVLVEIEFASAGLTPELSFGTHFFQDLVETDIFYAAIFPEKDNVIFNRKRLLKLPNMLSELFPDKAGFDRIIKVYDVKGMGVTMMADIVSQELLCHFA
jgi:hypothetical protein